MFLPELLEGVWLLNLGRGHSYGMLGLLVQLPENGNIILAGDIIYCQKNTEDYSSRQSLIIDKTAYDESYEKLMGLAQQYNAKIWFRHDMQQVQEIIKKKVYR